MAIIVFQHGESLGPGRLGVVLRDHGFRLDIRRLDLPAEQGGKPVPPDFDNVEAVISLGGAQNVGEDHPWMNAQLDYLRRAHEREIPVVGICLGAQLIAAALGGKVGPMDKPEWGFHNISILPPGQTETILAGIAWNSPQFCAHCQEVKDPPTDATILASSEACKVQAFRVGLRTYGFQYHFECDRAMIEDLARRDHAGCHAVGLDESRLAVQLDEHYTEFARLSDRLCTNIATYLFPLQRTHARRVSMPTPAVPY